MLARYGSKIDDLIDALRWACNGSADTALVVKLTIAAIPFWKKLSLVEECRAAVERALKDRFKGERTLREELILQVTLGATLLHTEGPVAKVRAALETAFEIAEALGDLDLQLESLKGLSQYELWIGDPHAALAFSERIRAIADAAGSPTGAVADAQAGSVLSSLGDLPASQRHLEKGIGRPLIQTHPRTLPASNSTSGSRRARRWRRCFGCRDFPTRPSKPCGASARKPRPELARENCTARISGISG